MLKSEKASENYRIHDYNKMHHAEGPTCVVPHGKPEAINGDVCDLDAQRALGSGIRAPAQRVGQRRLARFLEAGG